ncbi:MAG: hypothetical protein PHZ09_08930 [Eubacteriales bacterium]|nr:hypothetical protein [Eubacteriales bacterium]
MGILIFVVSVAVISSLIISLSAKECYDEWEKNASDKLNEYTVYDSGYEEMLIQINTEKEDYKKIESLYHSGNIIILSFGSIGIVTLFFVVKMTINERIREIGILYSIGMSMKYIFMTLLWEFTVFISCVIFTGFITAIFSVKILLRTDFIPDVINKYTASSAGVLAGVIAVTFVLILVILLMLQYKFAVTSPVRMIGDRK